MEEKENSIKVLCWTGKEERKPVKNWIPELENDSFKRLDKLKGLLKRA